MVAGATARCGATGRIDEAVTILGRGRTVFPNTGAVLLILPEISRIADRQDIALTAEGPDGCTGPGRRWWWRRRGRGLPRDAARRVDKARTIAGGGSAVLIDGRTGLEVLPLMRAEITELDRVPVTAQGVGACTRC